MAKGCINITVNDQKFIGKPGYIFIVNSSELHEIYGTVTPLEYSAFVFDFDILSFRKDDFAQLNFIEPVLREKMLFFNKVKSPENAYSLLKYINEINTAKPTCYLNNVRIENSMGMLAENNISVTEAAISCGFSNMSYFTRTFKKKSVAPHLNIKW